MILRKAEARTKFKTVHVVVLIVAAGLLASTAFLRTDATSDPVTTLTWASGIGLFLSGWLASMAMLLPGSADRLYFCFWGLTLRRLQPYLH